MSASTQAPVLIHRWFPRGEGWASHPDLAPRLRSLIEALADVLAQRRVGPFCLPTPAGVLLGELLEDPDCPDPLARARRPFILRAALLPTSPTQEQTLQVLRTLTALEPPSQPGNSLALVVPVEGMTAPGPSPSSGVVQATDPPRGRPEHLKAAFLVVGFFLCVILFGLALAIIPGACPSRTASPPEGPLPPSGSRSQGGLPPSARWREWLERVDHPYTAFLQDNEELLGSPPRPPLQSYEDWRKARRGRTFRDADRPLPAGLRRLVDQHRNPEDLVEPARGMAELVRAWKNAPDSSNPQVEFSALQTIEDFFHFLSRPPGLPAPGEVDHPYSRFLRRLPAEPVWEGRTLDDEPALAARLEELLRRLGVSPTSDSVNSIRSVALLEQLRREMDFEGWRHREESRLPFVSNLEEDPGPVVREAFEKKFGGVPKGVEKRRP